MNKIIFERKKLVIAGLVVGCAALVLVFQLSDTLSITRVAADNSPIVAGEDGEEISDTYLKLFKAYKQSDLIVSRSERTPGGQDFGRNPFQVPALGAAQRVATAPARTAVRPRQAEVRSPITLGGILWDQVSPSAVINKKVVQVGSMVGSYRVAEIFPDRVVLSNRKERLTLTLPKQRNR